MSPDVVAFLNVMKRGTSVDVYAEHFEYVTATVIVDTAPDGDGGLRLTLAGIIVEGTLVVTEAMINGVEYDDDCDCWCIRHGDLVFRFGLWGEGEPAF